MIRTLYARGRSGRTLARAAGALVLVAAIAGCVPSPAERQSPVESPNSAESPSAAAGSTAPQTPTADPTPTMDATPLGPLSGAWEGRWVNTMPTAAIGTFTLVWAQQGDKLFGALTVVGSNCLRAGNVTGEIAGKGLSFGAVEGDTTIQYTGMIVDDDTIEGTYESECGDSAGTWIATRATS